MRSAATASLVLVLALCLAGCAARLTPEAASIKEADEQMVAGCEFLGQVTGTSGFGNLASSTGVASSKNTALKKAAQKGATHVVWDEIDTGYTTSVSGKAYRCES